MITRADREVHNRPGGRGRLKMCMPGVRILKACMLKIWALMICAISTGCTGPSLEVATEPAEAELFVDGRLTASGAVIPFRYYGDILLQAEPPMEEGELTHVGVRRTVSVTEPVTPWVFPIDFLAEVIMWPFSGTEDQAVTLSLTENPARVQEGLEPAGAEGVRARSSRARVDR